MACVLGLILLWVNLGSSLALMARKSAHTVTADILHDYLLENRLRIPSQLSSRLFDQSGDWLIPQTTQAASAFSPHGPSSEPDIPASSSVVVVGGGASGLSAALALAEAGVDVVVLEAGPVVGGRTKSAYTRDGTNVDMGGQWIAPTQNSARRMIKRFNLTLFQTYYDPASATADFAPPAARKYRQELNEMANALPDRVDLAIESDKHLQFLDSISLAGWVDQAAKTESSDVQEYLKGLPTVSLNQPAEGVSLLFYLQAVKTFGSIEMDEGLRNGAQDSQLLEGTQSLSIHMAEATHNAGSAVYVNVSVNCISYNSSGVVIETASGQTLIAKRAVIAMGSSDRRCIKYTPPLPAEWASWATEWPVTTAFKFHLVYPRASWRDSNTTIPQLNLGAAILWDNSHPSGTPGVVMSLTAQLLPEPLFEYALAALAGLELGVWNHSRYFRQEWSEHAAGAANCAGGAGPGQLSVNAKGWRGVLGRLHWCGADTAQEWQGYISGAIESGSRVAKEVLVALRED